MTRKHARELAIHLIFELSFSGESAEELLDRALNRSVFERIGAEDPLYEQFPNAAQKAYISTLVKGVWEHGAELDEYISRYAIGWSFQRINRVVVCILRAAMYEILYMQDVPNAAAINSAVDLTRHYETNEVAAFVNGILGTFVRTELPEDAAPVFTDPALFDAAENDGAEP